MAADQIGKVRIERIARPGRTKLVPRPLAEILVRKGSYRIVEEVEARTPKRRQYRRRDMQAEE